MTDVATGLKQRFVWAENLCLESYEVLADGRSFERSVRDELAIGIFRSLGNTIDAIPPSSIALAEQLRTAQPELFEKHLMQITGAVGATFSPANATEFLDAVLAT